MSQDDKLLPSYSSYSDFYPGLWEPLGRIYVPFRLQGCDVRLAGLLDTGGHFCILGSDVMELKGRSFTEGSDDQTTLITAQGRISGNLYRHPIELLAMEGDNLVLEATILAAPDWRGPSVLGYTGLLDRMKFALDPFDNRFYFGL